MTRATNICTRCDHQWSDVCKAEVRPQRDEYGNEWELSGHFWQAPQKCPQCGSAYFEREEAA